MTTAVQTAPQSSDRSVQEGDRVLVVDAPSWCRRHFAGKLGRVVRILPFNGGGHAWVRFERPVSPWCHRMDAVDEFPFALDEIAAA